MAQAAVTKPVSLANACPSGEISDKVLEAINDLRKTPQFQNLQKKWANLLREWAADKVNWCLKEAMQFCLNWVQKMKSGEGSWGEWGIILLLLCLLAAGLYYVDSVTLTAVSVKETWALMKEVLGGFFPDLKEKDC